MKFNIGDLVYIKTSGEAGIVIPPDSANEIKVRRPVITKEHGIQFSVDFFQEYELETLTESLTRTLEKKIIESELVEAYMKTKESKSTNLSKVVM